MRYEKIIPFLLIPFLYLTGCADQKKDHRPTDAWVQQRLMEQRELDEVLYRSISSDFESMENRLDNEFGGDGIPDAFKGWVLPPLIQFPEKLEFKFAYKNYVKRVDRLNIGCEGRIEYEQFGKKHEITGEEFFTQVKWHTEKLAICGTLTIPDGQRLMLASEMETHLKDLELILNKNTFFSLWATNTEYEGGSPKLTRNHLSVIKLYFIKLDLENLK